MQTSLKRLIHFLHELGENPVFLRTAGFTYTRRVGPWPEGLARIAVIIGTVPLLEIIILFMARGSSGVFEALIVLTAVLVAPLLLLASVMDAGRATHSLRGYRKDSSLALTRLTFGDIAIGRCVGSAVFPLVLGVMLSAAALLMLIIWGIGGRRVSTNPAALPMILTLLACSPFTPEISIRMIRRAVVGTQSPWRSELKLALIPVLYIVSIWSCYYFDQEFFGWKSPFRLTLAGPLLIIFCIWRWRVCANLILSAGAAMEANMRAWWESGEHD